MHQDSVGVFVWLKGFLYDLEHECKLCSRSFSSSDPLEATMRSHITSSSAEPEDQKNPQKEKHPNALPTAVYGYGLREEPMKTWRRMEFDGDPSSTSRPPGIERKFSPRKVLLGHKMKCHRVNNSDCLEEEKEEEDEELDC